MGGVTYTVSCPECGKVYEIDYGATALYNPVSLFVTSTENGGRPLLEFLVSSKKIRKEAFELAEQGYTLDFDYEHKLYYCRKCRKIYSRFYFRLYKRNSDHTTDSYEPKYICCRCHNQLEQIEHDDCHNIEVSCSCGKTFTLDIDSDDEPLEWM